MTTPQLPDHGTTPWLDRYTDTSGRLLQAAGMSQDQINAFAAKWEEYCWPILAAAMEEAESAAVNAHRAMFNAANERLRSVLLTALNSKDDGKTSLLSYVLQLTAERDQARTERDAMLPVVEAAKAWRAMRADTPTKPKPESAALIAAVDQMATPTAPESTLPAQNDVPVHGQADLIQRLTERITAFVAELLKEELR